MRKKTVLYIEWASSGRDFEISLPTMFFFEKILGWEVVSKSIFDIPGILKTSPDLVIMSNTIGGVANLKLAGLISGSGFKLLSHTSEGYFRDNAIEEMVWGWNREKKLHEDMVSYWSKKSYDLAMSKFSKELQGKAVYTGSILHDKYKLYSTFKEVRSNYKYQITYASFDFVNVLAKTEPGKINVNERYIPIINKLLKDLVVKNPDILFIGKKHPGDGNAESLEMKGLEGRFENFKIVGSEYSIFDLAKSSNVWLSFRSSTNLEAWLLGTPTISFCNDEKFTMDSEIISGSIQSLDFNQINTYIRSFLNKETVKAYEEKKNIRKNYIKSLIEYDDGLNHVRFMSAIRPFIERVESGQSQKGQWRMLLKDRVKYQLRYWLYKLAKGRYNTPILKRYAIFIDRFSDKEVEKTKAFRFPDIAKFYQSNHDRIMNLYESYRSSL